jgi:hypothetical protein
MMTLKCVASFLDITRFLDSVEYFKLISSSDDGTSLFEIGSADYIPQEISLRKAAVACTQHPKQDVQHSEWQRLEFASTEHGLALTCALQNDSSCS